MEKDPPHAPISTDQFQPRYFRPHGRIESRVHGNLVVHEAIGPFNQEIIEAMAVVLRESLQTLKQQGRWGQVIVFRQSALTSPETLSALNAYTTQRSKDGLAPVATAYVMDASVEGCHLMEAPFRNVYSESTVQFDIFSTEADAITWVKAQL
jgi:hypothetical protein